MPLTVLVANRGEIARRVFRTARRMGLRTIAVHSDADAREPFVREADVAVRLGPAPARDSYLPIDRVVAQCVAAARGTRAVLGERDCSAQRRHQKIVEESPAPRLPDRTRAGLHAAASRLAREVGCVTAGTAEFIVDASGAFFFLEVN